jgi:adenylate cyclase
VRKGGNRVRITAQLIDALTVAHLWADRFDGLIEDVFELQDEVASSVAGVMEPTLQAAEIRRSAERPTSDLTAYDLYLRALPLYEAAEKNKTIEALEMLGQAIERDPHYSLALALASQCHAHLHVSGWTEDPGLHRRRAVDLAQRALRGAGDDPNTLGRAAHALGYSGGDLGAATALVDRCVELNPSYASGWINSGWLRLWAGQPDLAIEHLETGLRLNPRDRHHGAVMGIGVAHFFARRLESAAAMLLRSLQERPNWVPTYRFLASCYAHMGRLDEARETIERVRQITLVVVPSAAHWRDPEQRAFYLEGLRLAAGEET